MVSGVVGDVTGSVGVGDQSLLDIQIYSFAPSLFSSPERINIQTSEAIGAYRASYDRTSYAKTRSSVADASNIP